MLIPNERMYAERLLRHRECNSNRDINVLTKYLSIKYEMEDEDLGLLIESLSDLSESLIEPVIQSTLRERRYRPMQLLDKDITFSKAELEYCHNRKSKNEQKILFVLFVISKLYNNSFRFKKSEIIKFAQLPSNSQSYVDKILTKLYQEGVITDGYYTCNYVPYHGETTKRELRWHISDDVRKQLANDTDVALCMQNLNDDFILYFLDYYKKYFHCGKIACCPICGGVYLQSRNGHIKKCKYCTDRFEEVEKNTMDDLVYAYIS